MQQTWTCGPLRTWLAACVMAGIWISGCSDSGPADSAGAAPELAEGTSIELAEMQPPGLEGVSRVPAISAPPLIGRPEDAVHSDAAEAAETPASAATSESKPREPIYDTESPGEQLIAAALRRAQRDHKHVLIEWGGNWCGWCYKLHDVFTQNETIRPLVYEEFELVLVDEGNNRDLMLEYGGSDRNYSFPHLTILDTEGKVLTNQETGSLEDGPVHDPDKVAAFLKQWVPAKVDAQQALSEALARATAENKPVMMRVGTPYCGWCKVLGQFLQDHEAIFSKALVDLKIDTLRMTSGVEVAERFHPEDAQGIPWFVLLSPQGSVVATSVGPDGNVGYPFQPQEIAHFISVLRDTCSALTEDDLAQLESALTAYRTERESGSQ